MLRVWNRSFVSRLGAGTSGHIGHSHCASSEWYLALFDEELQQSSGTNITPSDHDDAHLEGFPTSALQSHQASCRSLESLPEFCVRAQATVCELVPGRGLAHGQGSDEHSAQQREREEFGHKACACEKHPYAAECDHHLRHQQAPLLHHPPMQLSTQYTTPHTPRGGGCPNPACMGRRAAHTTCANWKCQATDPSTQKIQTSI